MIGDWIVLVVIGGIVAWAGWEIFKPRPQNPMVNVGKCKVRVIFDELNPHEREFVGTAYWHDAFGGFVETIPAQERAQRFIDSTEPIRVDYPGEDDYPDLYIPRRRVENYRIIDVEEHIMQAL